MYTRAMSSQRGIQEELHHETHPCLHPFPQGPNQTNTPKLVKEKTNNNNILASFRPDNSSPSGIPPRLYLSLSKENIGRNCPKQRYIFVYLLSLTVVMPN